MQALYMFMFFFIPMIMVPLVTDWVFPNSDYIFTRFLCWPFLLIFYMGFWHFIDPKYFGGDNSDRAEWPPEILYSLPGMWIFTWAGHEVFIPLFLALIRHLVL